jgi:hypothetical protein
MSFDIEELKEEGTVRQDDGQDMSDADQKKSLIANVYSTDADDNYKDLSDWEDFDEMAYHLTKQDGLLRSTLKDITPSGSHEEWYCQLQVKLGHYIGDIVEREMPDGSEPEGAVPLLDFLAIDAGDILEYLETDEEVRETVVQAIAQTEMGQEAVREHLDEEEESDEEEQEAEAEADDD